jgi:hypothetical protein
MAKTYYKYAKRETTPVDYAGAAKDLSEGLMATVTGLEKKADKAAGEVAAAKSKIEKEFAKEEDRKRKEDEAIQEQYGDKISKAVDLPLSYQEDYKTVQSVILDLSADAADLKANIKREYDAGNMTTKDYNRKVNNIRDQFKMMKQTAVTSLDMVTATNTSVEEGDALPAQHYLLTKMLKGRFDSANAEYSIDEDGNIFADITDPKTGKVEQMSVYDMNKLSMQRLKPFDIDGQAEGLVDAIGSQLEMARGSGETIEDLLEKAPIMKRGNEAVTPMDYIEKNINGYSPNQLSSILQMKMSGNYDISTDPNNFGNDNFIVYEVSELSGQYEAKLTENQKQDAKDFATEAILTQLNPLKKPTTSSRDTEAQRKRQVAADAALEETTRLWNLFTGDKAEKAKVMDISRPAIETLLGKGNYGGYDITDDQIILYQKTDTGLEPRIIDIPSDFKSFVDLISTNFGLSDNLDEMYDKSTAGIEGFNPAAKYVTANVQKRPSIMYKPTKTIEDAADDLDDALGEVTSGWGYYGEDEITAGKIGLDAARGAKSYLTNIGLTKALVEKGDGNSVKITLDGVTPKGGIMVKLTETKKGAKSDLKAALKAIHDAAGMMQLVTGYPTAEDDDPNPEPANPFE